MDRFNAIGKVIQGPRYDEKDQVPLGPMVCDAFSAEMIVCADSQGTSSDLPTNLAPDSLVYITSAAAKIARPKRSSRYHGGKEDFR